MRLFSPLREIGRPAEVAHRLHAAGKLSPAALAFQILGTGRGAQQRHQMPAGRTAPDANPVGIEMEFLGPGPQKTDGTLAVLDLGREDRFLAEAVFDAGAAIAALGV